MRNREKAAPEGGPWPRRVRVWLRALVLAVVVLPAMLAGARADELSRDDLAARLSPPFVLGARDADLPIWPIFRAEGGQEKLAGWLFESADLAPIPGFSGTPPNLLIQLGTDGAFRRVSVVSQHEPVFVDGLGPEPLDRFVEQYTAKTLAQNVKVGPPRAGPRPRDGANAVIDGVAKATASVRIVNESVLAAALTVARAKLGLTAPAGPVARIRDEVVPMSFAELEAAGLIVHRTIREADLEAAFAGTEGAGLDPRTRAAPDAVFADLRIALLNIPTVGVNLLGAERWAHLAERRPGAQFLWLSIGGRARPFDDGWVHGATPDAFALTQNGLALDLKDIVHDHPPALAEARTAPFVVLEVFGGAGFDPARPWTLSWRQIREKGQIFPTRIAADLAVEVRLPERWFEAPSTEAPAVSGWRSVWVDRQGDLAILAAALLALGLGLAFQPRTMRAPRLVAGLRLAYLAFTLVGIGWIFQAQLSIVTLAGLVKAALVTRDLGFLLWDPPSLVLWAVVIVTAIVWGRGTFCGWLCPFGALQEGLAVLARPLRLPQWRVPERLDQRLRGLKYLILLGFLAVAVVIPDEAEVAAEVEPFKTAITLVFQRSWPALAYVGVLLAANLFVYKAFCRWLCPLGAFVAVLGRLRRFDWIARRVECGAPCRLCERKCRYGAIDRAGTVDYDECFQCMDCVVIHQDATTCVPLVLAARRAGAGRRPTSTSLAETAA